MTDKELDPYEKIQTPESVKVLPIETKQNNDEEEKVQFSLLSLYRYATTWDRLLLGIGVLMSIINGGSLPIMAILFGDAINNFSTQDQSAINQTALDFFILALVLLVSGYGSYACFTISGERQMRALRREVLKHIMYQEMEWYDERDASALASRISGDTVKIKEGMGEKLGEALKFVFQFFVGYGIGFYKGWNLALAMCAMMPILALSLTYLVKRLGEATARSQQAYADAGAVAEETIGAIRTVASLNREPKAIQKYGECIDKAEVATLGMAKVMSFSNGWMALSIWLPYTIGLWYGGYLVKEQNQAVNSPGSVFSAFYGILMGTTSLAQISPNISAVASAKGAAFALFEILARPSKTDASKLDGEVPTSCEGKIEIKDVCFAYPSRPEAIVLQDYSLTIEKGQTVALVGLSGS
ncbi:ATP-binding Cassette (ABC) Superfamily, partial [Thraustotheca clavata]